MRRITHRELRNNSSEVLRAVDSGESFEITNYGRVVALIIPARPAPLEALRTAGRTVPPTGSVADLLSTPAVPVPVDSAEVLDEMRIER